MTNIRAPLAHEQQNRPKTYQASMGESIVILAVGIILAVLLLLVGMGLGMRLSRARLSEADDSITRTDREQILHLLNELVAWTSEYSGNVSNYQELLGKINDEMRTDTTSDPSEQRVMSMLQEIMQSNSQLQNRLDAAERQLEKQTQQIQHYLTEARTDSLTGLSNRRAFEQKLQELFMSYRNGGRSFVMVLIDVDRFKSINDTYGHQIGDRVLQHLASSLRTQLDRSIMVARFGGEEFAVLMNGPLRVAADQMNEVRRVIAHEPFDWEGSRIEVTISIGLSEPRDELVVGPILRRADEALYAAKKIGRNRVYYHDGKAPTLVGAPEVARS